MHYVLFNVRQTLLMRAAVRLLGQYGILRLLEVSLLAFVIKRCTYKLFYSDRYMPMGAQLVRFPVKQGMNMFPANVTCSYCTLDYGRLLDVTQLRLFKMRKALKDKLKDRCNILFCCSIGL